MARNGKAPHWHKAVRACALAVLAALPQTARAQSFEIETGLDVIASPDTRIEGLHRFFAGRRVSPGFSFGQSIYSAALGDAGGAFFWGVEGIGHLPLNERFSLSFAGFLGGGGGAAQVNGDGLMLRAGITLDTRLSPAWDLQLGASWVRVEGAAIDGPAYSLGLRYRFGARQTTGRDAGARAGATPGFDAIALGVTRYSPASGSRTRSGTAQPAVTLVGARALFDLTPQTQLSFSAHGAARGAEGYMQIMTGLRRRLPLGRLTFFAEGAAGLGGGGDADTGAGLLLQAALGLDMPLSRRFSAELSLGALVAPDGDFRAAALSLDLVHHFNRTPADAPPARWAYTIGAQIQRTGAGYFRSPGPHDSHVVMHESTLDYYISERAYVMGSALTTMGGNVAGYALGMIGLGYEIPLGERWSLSLEGMIGAAGGGGVNTAGGAIVGLRAELDWHVAQTWRLSLGLGQLATTSSGGMRPATLSLGVKIPFSTHH